MIQTDLVIDLIKRKNPGVRIDREIIKTGGDQDQKTPLFSLEQKGIFEKEIDQAVLDRRVDFAVHSMKDIPVFAEDSQLVIASVPERGPVEDVLVSRNAQPLGELKTGGKIGTSSLLRVAELRRKRPDLNPIPIRGNVETRIQKVDKGDYDAVVLAEAGLARLGMMDRISERLSVHDFIPAPGQGALAVVSRRDHLRVIDMLKLIEHPPTRTEVEAERETVRVLEGGCKVPVGTLARAQVDHVYVTAQILSIDGRESLVSERSGPASKAAILGREVAEELVSKGAKKIEETWRVVYA